jgi:hemerythrin-like domain-containing protein
VVLLVHKAFRETGQEIATGLARLADADIDPERVRGVADIWNFYSRSLQGHHVHEDDAIWPKVVERKPDFSEIEKQMEQEHGEVDRVLEPAGSAVAAMRTSPDPTTIKAAAEAIAACVRELDEHLDHEEAIAFPVVQQALGRKEFDKMGEEFLRSTPKADLPYAAASLDEMARSVPEAERPPPPPIPVRLLIALSWRRKYRRFVAPLREAS